MRKIFITLVLLASATGTLTAQHRLEGYHETLIADGMTNGDVGTYDARRWAAWWIEAEGTRPNEFTVSHFRKSFELDSVPEHFIIHITADNRFKLWVNDSIAVSGPAHGDLLNWNFETADIAPYLKPGKNTLAAVVWNFARHRPLSEISSGATSLLVQGNGEAEQAVNTDKSWKALKSDAYAPEPNPLTWEYFAIGSFEQLDGNRYPWGWETQTFDDTAWNAAQERYKGAVKGAIDRINLREIVPSPLPPMEMTPQRLARVRKAEGIDLPAGFPAEKASFTVPAHRKATLLFDQNVLTTAYPTLIFSGGKGSRITMGYAEALFDEKMHKHNRDSIEGKRFLGYRDVILPDGGKNRNYTSLWWRTWRYLQLEIETAGEPLTIDDLYGTFTAYPFVRKSRFDAPENPELEQMLDIGWRTARLCAHDSYMDCPYYEQLQYFGDTRIQTMVTLYNTDDKYMVRNALEQGRQSMTPDGITLGRYPSLLPQFIPSFSVWWIGIGYDLWQYRGDEEYLRTLLPAFRSVVAWYERYLKPDGSLKGIPYWFFVDWAPGHNGGMPKREKEGDSSIQDLHLMLAYRYLAAMEEGFGIPALAGYYREQEQRMKEGFKAKYWDEGRGLFADTKMRDRFSQHANTLAVLAEVVTGEEAREVMERTLADSSLIRATVYFSYYLNQALNKTGLGDRLLNDLTLWERQMELGLTTWAETAEPSRSDCHAWSAAPNVEFFRMVLGIASDGGGFRKIRIAPSLGTLTEVNGAIPHPNGEVAAAYKRKRNGALEATLTLPEGTTGVFVWKGKEYPLHAGKQIIFAK